MRNSTTFMVHVSESSPTWETVASTLGPEMCGYEEMAGVCSESATVDQQAWRCTVFRIWQSNDCYTT